MRELSDGADQERRRRGRRLRRAHADAGPDRLPRARHPQRGQHPLHGGDAADAAHRAGGDAAARHARPRLHHRARHRRLRLGHQDGRRAGPSRRARASSSPASRSARRAATPTAAGAPTTSTGCACCNGLAVQVGDRRRQRRGAQGRARADAPGRRPREDHDVGRRRLALRPARQPAVLRRRGARRGRGGDRLRPLRLRPRLFGRGDHARGAARRAHHRARQPDRRRGGQADGREGHVPGRQPRRLLRHEGAGGEVRHDGGEPGEERASSSKAASGRSRSASATACRSPTAATCWASCTGTRAASSRSGARWWRRSRSSARRRPSPRRSCASRARSARSRPAPWPTSWWSTAIRLQDLALLEDQGKHLSVIMKAGKFHKRRLQHVDPGACPGIHRPLAPVRAEAGSRHKRRDDDNVAELAVIGRMRKLAPASAARPQRRGGGHARLHPDAARVRHLAGVLPPGDPLVSAGGLFAALVPGHRRQRPLRLAASCSACSWR